MISLDHRLAFPTPFCPLFCSYSPFVPAPVWQAATAASGEASSSTCSVAAAIFTPVDASVIAPIFAAVNATLVATI